MHRLRLLLLSISSVLVWAGCQQQAPPAESQQKRAEVQQKTAKLRILVVEDPEISGGLKLLRGEWAERSGGELELVDWTLGQLLSASQLQADLILYPSRHLGTLVDRDWLRPVRNSVLKSKDLALDDMFSLIRNATLPYGNEIFAFSLGEPPVLLASPWVRQEEINFATWGRVRFRLTAEKSTLRYPLATELLTRALASGQRLGEEGSWFDVESMQPRLSAPASVRALQQMLENVGSPSAAPTWVSLGWPRAEKESSQRPLRFVALPQSVQVYDRLRETWAKKEISRGTQPLVLLGFAGRSIGVTRSTRNSASAFKLLRWLMSENISTQLSSRSKATVWFRKSQLSQVHQWLAYRGSNGGSGGATSGSSNAGSNFEAAATISQMLSSDNYYLLPRIPGVDQYLELLDSAVASALEDSPGDVENGPSSNAKTVARLAEETLAKVVQQWNGLTDRYGRDRQRTAYRKHLGLVSEFSSR